MNIVKAIPGMSLCLGNQNENNTTQIEFDLSGYARTYGDGVATLVASRAGDSELYPVVTTQEGSVVRWLVGREWTAVAGTGQCQLSWVVGAAIAKTVVFETNVRSSLTVSEEPSDPRDEYLEQILLAGASAVNGAERAEKAAAVARTCSVALENASASERDRLQSELIRVKNENERVSNETARAVAEAQRKEATQKAVETVEGIKRAYLHGELNGDDGKSAYEVACDAGFEGTEEEWLLSLHGKDGKAGKDGVQIDDADERSDATWSSLLLAQKFANVAVIIKPDWKPFNQCTWEEIANIARRYDPSEYWKVGDWKPLPFVGRNGAQFMVPFVIIDFDKDSVADVRTYGKRYAGLTAMLGGNRLITEQYSPWISGVYEPQKGLLPDILIEETTGNYTYGMFKCPNRVAWDGSKYIDVTKNVAYPTGEGVEPIDYAPHADYPSSTGTWWPQSGARHALQSIFDGAQDGFNADDVVAVEKVTSKYYRPALGNEFHTVTKDKVWLLSETEFWGKQYSSPAIEGEQYEYFKKGASKFFWGDKLLGLSAEQIDSTKPYNLWTRSSAQEHLNDQKPTMSYSTCVKNTIYSKDADGAFVGYSYGNDKYVGGYFVPGCCL